MQKGQIFLSHGAWFVRYRTDGKQKSQRLCAFSDQYRTMRSVRPLADDILEPINAGREVSGPITLQQYAEAVYFPNVKNKLKPSTYKGYFNLYRAHVQSRIGGLRFSTFTTADGQKLLYRIAESEDLSHQSFLNINSLMSAFFTHARRSGALTGQNPMDGVEVPQGRRTEKITAALEGVARCAVVVAAWTGLSLAELRGLKWEDIDFKNEKLNVNRTVWHKEVIDTKTEHRKAAVHLLPNVVKELKKFRKNTPSTTWVFEGPRIFPLDLATLGSKRIKYALGDTGVRWYGFHAFRRGLGTRLYNNGVPTKTIATILRHGTGSEVTEENYIDVDESTAADALKNLPQKA